MNTKIICTIGPSSSSEEMLKKLIVAGMSIARVNCSHGTIEQNAETMKRVMRVRAELNSSTLVMLDTKGPDIRIGAFEEGEIVVDNGQTFTFYADPKDANLLGTKDGVFVNYEKMPKKVRIGQELRLNDGMVFMNVTGVSDSTVTARVTIGGVLKNRKSLAIPGCDLELPFISKADEDDLRMGVEIGVDVIAASFVSCAQDVVDMRAVLEKFGGPGIKIISKIESWNGIKNLDEIVKVSDGVMVARGDLGIEFNVEELPVLQRIIIRKGREVGIIVVTATEMMESMIEKPRPTRAEVSDVENAVWDGTQYVMTSAETASGKFPVQCVQYMARAAAHAEKHPEYFRF